MTGADPADDAEPSPPLPLPAAEGSDGPDRTWLPAKRGCQQDVALSQREIDRGALKAPAAPRVGIPVGSADWSVRVRGDYGGETCWMVVSSAGAGS